MDMPDIQREEVASVDWGKSVTALPLPVPISARAVIARIPAGPQCAAAYADRAPPRTIA